MTTLGSLPVFCEGRISPTSGLPIFDVSISKDEGSKQQTFRALLDTGANVCCVSDRMVRSLGLKVVGKSEIVFPSGRLVSDSYALQLNFSLNKGSDTLISFPTEVFKCIMPAQDFDIIIGNNIISRGSYISIHDSFFWLAEADNLNKKQRENYEKLQAAFLTGNNQIKPETELDIPVDWVLEQIEEAEQSGFKLDGKVTS